MVKVVLCYGDGYVEMKDVLWRRMFSGHLGVVVRGDAFELIFQ